MTPRGAWGACGAGASDLRASLGLVVEAWAVWDQGCRVSKPRTKWLELKTGRLSLCEEREIGILGWGYLAVVYGCRCAGNTPTQHGVRNSFPPSTPYPRPFVVPSRDAPSTSSTEHGRVPVSIVQDEPNAKIQHSTKVEAGAEVLRASGLLWALREPDEAETLKNIPILARGAYVLRHKFTGRARRRVETPVARSEYKVGNILCKVEVARRVVGCESCEICIDRRLRFVFM